MTPVNTPVPGPKPVPPLWQRIAIGTACIAMAFYLIFAVALPDFRARQAAIDGPTSQSSAPAH